MYGNVKVWGTRVQKGTFIFYATFLYCFNSFKKKFAFITKNIFKNKTKSYSLGQRVQNKHPNFFPNQDNRILTLKFPEIKW